MHTQFPYSTTRLLPALQRPFCEAYDGSVGQHREQSHRGHKVRPHAHPLRHFGIRASHERDQLVADQEKQLAI